MLWYVGFLAVALLIAVAFWAVALLIAVVSVLVLAESEFRNFCKILHFRRFVYRSLYRI